MSQALSGRDARFRLLPSRTLPCAALFQQTVEPVVPKRVFPSGLTCSRPVRWPATRGGGRCGRRWAMPSRRRRRSRAGHCLAGEPARAQDGAAEATSGAAAGGGPGTAAQRGLARQAALDLPGRLGRAAAHLGPPCQVEYGRGGHDDRSAGIRFAYPAFYRGLGRLARDSATAFPAATDILEPKLAALELRDSLGGAQAVAARRAALQPLAQDGRPCRALRKLGAEYPIDYDGGPSRNRCKSWRNWPAAGVRPSGSATKTAGRCGPSSIPATTAPWP